MCHATAFLTTMDVSCWTFIRMAHLAEPLMRKGGTLFTMTYYGSQMVVKNYNIMGVAKAALERAVRYLAAELGPKGIRVHAISPGPLATRAAWGIRPCSCPTCTIRSGENAAEKAFTISGADWFSRRGGTCRLHAIFMNRPSHS